MIDVIVVNDGSSPPTSFHTSSPVDKGIPYTGIHCLEKQAQELNVSINIRHVSKDEIPTNTKNFLVCFLSNKSIIPVDYLGRVLAINNLFRSSYVFLGDHSTLKDNTELYKTRKIGNTPHELMIKTKLEYSLFQGVVISGHYYNSVGGLILEKNKRFTTSFCKNIFSTDIIWSNRLNVFNFEPTPKMNEYWYNYGSVSSGPSLKNSDLQQSIDTEVGKWKTFFDLGYYETHENLEIEFV
mgnify:CR=1 FL=1